MKKTNVYHWKFKLLPLGKIIRVMKITAFLLLIAFIQVSAATYSQSTKLNLTYENVKLSDLLDKIEKTSEYRFFYDSQSVDMSRTVTVDLKDSNLKEVLNKVLSKNLTYEMINSNIVVIKCSNAGEVINQQPSSISGRVTDSSGAPLPGVTVVVKGTTKGTVTDFDGNYSIGNVPGNATLQFSFVGMKTQEISVAGKNSINVTMIEDAIGIEEVVAIGYGVVKKSDLTGAVSSVKSDELPKAANTSIQQMLSGKAAGLQVTTNDAQPGGAVSILIRGAASTGAGNEPLYIIDGFPVSGGVDPDTETRYTKGSRSPLSSINPNDIESIEILKDASATAIYGARAANGVIILTTKMGEEGKVTVNYDGKHSFQLVTRPWDMMDATEFMLARNSYRREKWMAENSVDVYGGVDPGSVENPYLPAYTETQIAAAGKGTDWFDEVTRTGIIKDHNINVSGNSNKTNYLVSFSYFDQNGVVKKNNYNRLTSRINLDQEVTPWLKFGVRATASRINIDNPSLGTGGNENSGVIRAALLFSPTLPVKTENGEYSYVPNSTFFPNPVSLLEITNNTIQDRIFANTYLEANPIKELKFRMQIGFDKQEGTTRLYLPKSTLYGASVGGQATINQNNRLDQLLNMTLAYKAALSENHRIDVLAGYEYQKFGTDGFGLATNNFSTDAFLYNNIGAGEAERPRVSSYRGLNELASYFGRINYALKEKYLLTMTMRADGSTKFGEGNKFGYFPSGAIAWRISQEEFIKDANWLSNLKIRLSGGQTGNSNISGAFSYYSFGRNYIFGNSLSSGSYLSSYANPSLKWETTTEYNLGLDFGFFENRITGAIEVYRKKVDDLLGSIPLPYYQTLSEVAANIGATSSKGYEFTLNTLNINRDLRWSSIFNISGYRDRWEERNPSTVLASYESEKDPIRVHWGYLTDGLVQPDETIPHMPGALAGTMKIKDINGYDDRNHLTGQPDGIINNADRVKIASVDPDFIFGFTNTFEYKSFDLNVHIYGMVGLNKWNNYLSMAADLPNINRGWNVPNVFDQFWSSENQGGKYPNINVTNPFPGGDQYLLQKADFVRVKNVTFGYNFSNLGLRKKYFKTARVYLDVSNPFLFTSFSGIDPEYDGLYPVQKTVTLGLNLQF